MSTEKIIIGGVFFYPRTKEIVKVIKINSKSVNAISLNNPEKSYLTIKSNDLVQLSLTHDRMSQLGFIQYDMNAFMIPNPKTLEPNYDAIIRFDDGIFYLGNRIIRNVMHLQAIMRFYAGIELKTNILS